jgi:hypothetical protein
MTGVGAMGVLAAVTGSIVAAKAEKIAQLWGEARRAGLPPGVEPDANHDEAKAIRRAQMSTLRTVARTANAGAPLFDLKAQAFYEKMEAWAAHQMDRPNEAVEAALRQTHVGGLARLGGEAEVRRRPPCDTKRR